MSFHLGMITFPAKLLIDVLVLSGIHVPATRGNPEITNLKILAPKQGQRCCDIYHFSAPVRLHFDFSAKRKSNLQVHDLFHAFELEK